MAKKIQIAVFWFVTSCSDLGYRRFGRPFCVFTPKRWYLTTTLHGLTTQNTLTCNKVPEEMDWEVVQLYPCDNVYLDHLRSFWETRNLYTTIKSSNVSSVSYGGLCLTKHHAMKTYWGWRYSSIHS